MLLVLSPAKSLELKKPISCTLASQPILDTDKKPIVSQLKKWKAKEIAETLSLSDKLAELNYQRYQALGTKESLAETRQAIFTFDGEVYTGFDAYSLNKKQYEFTEKTVRILSGLYGVLNPFDLIEPYRLEMGTKISIGKHTSLYSFWTEKVTNSINADLKDSSHLLNLASQEYFKVINVKEITKPILQFDFLEEDKKEWKNISFFSKKARGLMARYIIDHKVKKVEHIKDFDYERYSFHSKLSTDSKLVFTRKYQPIGKK
jgi:cytoplasmic iron level regulating protein YaaA (DUF328/UPF0246 family)